MTQAAKILIDRLGAALLLAFLAVALVAIGLAVKLSSRGPVFYLQTRIGRAGKAFTIVKFRTMTPGSDRAIPAISDGAGPLFKLHRDPRVTRVGAVLRRFSLDELPQLFNVLGGSMSLVGPRPSLPSEVATYTPHVARRLKVKPGITGLWQVSGRSDLSWDESVRLDLSYVDGWSLGLDAEIVRKTFRAVLSGHGAY